MILLTITIVASGQDTDHCVWYGECGLNLQNFLPYNCPYTGPGLLLENEVAENLLLEYCPDIFEDRK